MPRLTQMAYDFLTIPAMSSECQRLFSSAKLTVTPQRQRLKADIIEAIEMMNKWFRRGLVNLLGDDDIRAAATRYDTYTLIWIYFSFRTILTSNYCTEYEIR